MHAQNFITNVDWCLLISPNEFFLVVFFYSFVWCTDLDMVTGMS